MTIHIEMDLKAPLAAAWNSCNEYGNQRSGPCTLVSVQ